MKDILHQFPTPYIDSQTLLLSLKGYAKPRDWIARQVKLGRLIRLKNGFYLIVREFEPMHYGSLREGPSRSFQGILKEKAHSLPYEQVANLLFGPSYVSLEWALSFYGFIPERVTVVTSMTLAKNKEFETPIAKFTYRHMKTKRYSVGVIRKEIEGQFGGFLIATPEKALADWVFLTCKGLSSSELLSDLLESKRIEKDKLQSLDMDFMERVAEKYDSEIIYKLLKVLRTL